MRQEQFERSAEPRWREFEQLLDALERQRDAPAAEFPALYRRVCQDLALARDRHFSRDVHERLNRLALRGHQQLYQARTSGARWMVDLAAGGFPRAVRAEWRLHLLLAVLFYGAGVFVVAAIQIQPDLAYSFLSPESIARIETMYDPATDRIGVDRGAGSDAQMFGFYVWNNISLAFRTFAAGLCAGVLTLVIVGANALSIGAVFGHLTQIGHGEPLYGFIVAHGAFELTAILISGMAGMRLGLGWIAPGRRSRGQALRDAARVAVPLVAGAGGMLLVAAAIEAFWSPRVLPIAVKYAVGASAWAFVILYLGLAGRRRES